MFDNFFERLYRQYITNDGLALTLNGLLVTLQLALVGLIIGIALGVIFGIMKVMPRNTIFGKVCYTIASGYVTVIRGIPLAVQLLLGYFGILGPLGIDPLPVGMLIMGINSSAYVAEIIRSGIQAVDIGQTEAGRSLGLSYGATMRKIILPQAVKNILPALGNEFVVLIKETSIVGFITITDLTRATGAIVSRSYDVFVPYIVLAVAYLVLVMLATGLVNLLERRMRRSDSR